MRVRVTTTVLLALAAPLSFAEDQAAISFSGKGNQPIEIRDADGNVTEVIGQRSLSLNSIPADAAAREAAFRESQIERASELAAEAQQERDNEAAAEAAAAKAAEEAAAKAAAEAAAAEEEFDPTPRKVRRKTVRGTRLIATEPTDPSLRTPTNTGLRQIDSGATPAPRQINSESTPAPPGPRLEHPRRP